MSQEVTAAPQRAATCSFSTTTRGLPRSWWRRRTTRSPRRRAAPTPALLRRAATPGRSAASRQVLLLPLGAGVCLQRERTSAAERLACPVPKRQSGPCRPALRQGPQLTPPTACPCLLQGGCEVLNFTAPFGGCQLLFQEASSPVLGRQFTAAPAPAGISAGKAGLAGLRCTRPKPGSRLWRQHERRGSRRSRAIIGVPRLNV